MPPGKTSVLYPPSTGYRRPPKRKFYVWRDRAISYRHYRQYPEDWELHPWRWCCTLCDPPAFGFRARKGAFEAVMTISMPHHFYRRRAHHRWAASKPIRPDVLDTSQDMS